MAHKITILSVDDSKMMRTMISRALTPHGYNVALAEDGIHGLEVLKSLEHKPVMILTDINMPRMDGFDFIKSVRQLKDFASLPIVCLTTEVDEVKKKHARDSGATGWITKPFNAEKLLWTIKRVTK